jgi:hypothetical protein
VGTVGYRAGARSQGTEAPALRPAGWERAFHPWGEPLEFTHACQLEAGGRGENRHEGRRYDSTHI